MTAAIYSEEMVIPFFFSNANGEVSLASLIDMVLYVSEKQLVQYKLDGQHVAEKGYGWVVTQYHMDIERMPLVNENIKISTQAKSFNKFFCYRDFWIEDMQGNKIVSINSIFVIIDLKARKMIKVPAEIFEPLGSVEISGMEKFPRIKKEKEFTKEDKVHIGYYNIDLNQHVNNSYYFDWMTDSLDFEFLNSHKLKSVDIKYEHELAYGDNPVVQCKIIQDENEIIETRHSIKNAEDRNAEAIMKWA